jgi:hypothetical protein
MKIKNVYMKIICIMFIIISFSAPLYAADDFFGTFNLYDAYRIKLQQEKLKQEREIVEEQLQFEREKNEAQKKLQEEQNRKNLEQENLNQLTRYLDHAVPDWKQIASDPNFQKWLDDTIPSTTYTRRQLLSASFAEGNRWEVAKFFNDYKESSQRQKSSIDNTISNVDRNCYDNCKKMYESKQLKRGVGIKECMRVICN